MPARAKRVTRRPRKAASKRRIVQAKTSARKKISNAQLGRGSRPARNRVTPSHRKNAQKPSGKRRNPSHYSKETLTRLWAEHAQLMTDPRRNRLRLLAIEREAKQIATFLASARRNPDEDGEAQAAALSSSFHGRPVRTVKDYETDIRTRAVLADLGRLIELRVITDDDQIFELTFNGVRLASSGDGQQLYFVGGDQALDLASMDLEHQAGKDHARIGEVEAVAYYTSKDFHDFEPSVYEHAFGEEGGTLPSLNYDALNKTLYLSGGTYKVKREGITD